MSDSKDRSREPRETSDPFAWWREWLVQSERQWNTALNELMGTDQFASSMGRWMELYLGVQKNLNETLGRALTGMNVPNRDDVAELGQRLSAIEERLARIETMIERGSGVSAAPSERRRPPRTRKPPSVRAAAAPPPASHHPATPSGHDRAE
jgi:polyhydroxyalkanoic acid synthase PhaR subunit